MQLETQTSLWYDPPVQYQSTLFTERDFDSSNKKNNKHTILRDGERSRFGQGHLITIYLDFGLGKIEYHFVILGPVPDMIKLDC